MKRILLIIILALPIIAHAQNLPIDSSSNRVSYSEVVKVDGASKDELYTRAREWFAKTFRSAQSVLQMDDKEAGKLVGKGNMRGRATPIFMVDRMFTERYTITITVKDGRYRYELSDFTTQLDADKYGSPGEIGIEYFAFNSKNKNNKGEFRNSVKDYILITDIIGTSIPPSLKEAMAKSASGMKSKDDF